MLSTILGTLLFTLSAMNAATLYKDMIMYRLMKSEKFNHIQPLPGSGQLYRQLQIKRFEKFRSAMAACKIANGKDGSRYYVLNDAGKEFYENSWID